MAICDFVSKYNVSTSSRDSNMATPRTSRYVPPVSYDEQKNRLFDLRKANFDIAKEKQSIKSIDAFTNSYELDEAIILHLVKAVSEKYKIDEKNLKINPDIMNKILHRALEAKYELLSKEQVLVEFSITHPLTEEIINCQIILFRNEIEFPSKKFNANLLLAEARNYLSQDPCDTKSCSEFIWLAVAFTISELCAKIQIEIESHSALNNLCAFASEFLNKDDLRNLTKYYEHAQEAHRSHYREHLRSYELVPYIEEAELFIKLLKKINPKDVEKKLKKFLAEATEYHKAVQYYKAVQSGEKPKKKKFKHELLRNLQFNVVNYNKQMYDKKYEIKYVAKNFTYKDD